MFSDADAHTSLVLYDYHFPQAGRHMLVIVKVPPSSLIGSIARIAGQSGPNRVDRFA